MPDLSTENTLPRAFTARMRTQLGSEYDAFISSYLHPPMRGLRVNTLRLSPSEFVRISPWKLSPSGVIDEGFVLESAAPVGRHPFHCAGLFYMQEPSAMSVIEAAHADDSGLRVLDMCAAPGGKTSGIAARMKGNGILVANEIAPSRAKLLARNVERMGIANIAVTCAHPDGIARELPGCFDRVIVDAPCSGEGMFRKDPTAVAEWSPEHVTACAARQRAILESAAVCVAADGLLVYSTCTFSTEENEGVIESFLNIHPDFALVSMHRLYPHSSVGEGHFAAVLRRLGGERRDFDAIPPSREDRAILAAGAGFIEGTAAFPEKLKDGAYSLVAFGESVCLIPSVMPRAVLRLSPVAIGAEAGTFRKGRIVPAHAFFMSALPLAWRHTLEFDPGSRELAAFMKGSSLECSSSLCGFLPVCVRAGNASFAIGFGKAVQGTLKNHLPKGLYVH